MQPVVVVLLLVVGYANKEGCLKATTRPCRKKKQTEMDNKSLDSNNHEFSFEVISVVISRNIKTKEYMMMMLMNAMKMMNETRIYFISTRVTPIVFDDSERTAARLRSKLTPRPAPKKIRTYVRYVIAQTGTSLFSLLRVLLGTYRCTVSTCTIKRPNRRHAEPIRRVQRMLRACQVRSVWD